MSELQMALIGLGVLLVAAVWGFNLWQERKLRRQAGEMLPTPPDVLMADRSADTVPARAEPTIGDTASPIAADAVPPAPTFADHDQSGAEQAADVEITETTSLPADWAADPFDCLLRIEFVDAVPAALLWAEKASLPADINKPVQWFGLDGKTARWRVLLPQDAGAVTQLVLALQLADRRGPVDEKVLAAFLGGAHQLAQKFAGLVELPELPPVLQRAAALDALCAGVDMQLSLLVVPRSGSLNDMVGTRLAPLLAEAGLREVGERFVAAGSDGQERFALSCRDAAGAAQIRLDNAALAGLVFSIDVPRVSDGGGAFEHMLALARRSAETLGGQLVDAHQQPLPEAKLAAIQGRIAELQQRMAAAGLPAGSPLALRLFA